MHDGRTSRDRTIPSFDRFGGSFAIGSRITQMRRVCIAAIHNRATSRCCQNFRPPKPLPFRLGVDNLSSATPESSPRVRTLACVEAGSLDESTPSAVVVPTSLEEFWGIYLDAHRHPVNRWLHVAGTLFSAGVILFVLFYRAWWWLPLAPVVGYGPAWLGHALIERNKPLTLSRPLWSLLCDYRLTFRILTGRGGRLSDAVSPSSHERS